MQQIIGQAVGILAMAFNIFSYQQKKQTNLLVCQLMGASLFAVNFFLLGAWVGALLNIVAAVRTVLFLFKEKLKTTHPIWLIGFSLLFVAFYVLSFTVFGTAPTVPNFLLEVLPVVGSVALSLGYMLDDTTWVRRMGLISSPAWLIYNIYHLSVGAIVCEVLSLISIFLGILRHDKKKRV